MDYPPRRRIATKRCKNHKKSFANFVPFLWLFPLTKKSVFVYRVNRYPPTRLEADRCCKVAVGRGGAEVRRKSASTVWRALGGNDPFGLCRGFLPGTSSWRRDSRFP